MPGIEPVISTAQGLRPDQVVGFIEAVLLDWSWSDEEFPDGEFPGELRLPVDKARDFGFITAEEEQQARVNARAQTLRAIAMTHGATVRQISPWLLILSKD